MSGRVKGRIVTIVLAVGALAYVTIAASERMSAMEQQIQGIENRVRKYLSGPDEEAALRELDRFRKAANEPVTKRNPE